MIDSGLQWCCLAVVDLLLHGVYQGLELHQTFRDVAAMRGRCKGGRSVRGSGIDWSAEKSRFSDYHRALDDVLEPVEVSGALVSREVVAVADCSGTLLQ